METAQLTTRGDIDAVLASYPTLNYAGMIDQSPGTLETERQRLREAGAEVDRARAALRDSDVLTRFAGRRVNSYQLKHVPERDASGYLGYVSQGSMIVAAILEGFAISDVLPNAAAVTVEFPGRRERRRRAFPNWCRSPSMTVAP